MRRVLWALLLAGLLLLISAQPAAAHARLLETDPAEGAVVPTRPDQVTLTFDQPITPIDEGFELYSADRPPRPIEATASGASVHVVLPDDIGQGTFLITWRVRSEDSHVISGVLEFSIGQPGPPPTGPALSVDALTEPVQIGFQALAYLGLLTAIGLAIFDSILATRPAARIGQPGQRFRRRTERMGAIAGMAGPIGIAVLAGVRGVSIIEPLVAVLLAVAGLSLLLATPDRRTVAGRIMITAGAVLAASSVLPVGHSRSAGPAWLMMPADVLHVLTGAIWFGGLLGLVILLIRTLARPGPDTDPQPTATVVGRFSMLAGASLVTLAATGTVQALLILPEPQALTETNYGRTLLVKIGLTLVAAAIASYNHFWLVPQVRDVRTRTDGVAKLRRTALNEVAIIALAVVTAGVLVGQSPVTDEPGPSQPREFTAALGQSRVQGQFKVQGRIEPARVGGNTVEWSIVDAAGRKARPVELPRLRAFHRASGLGPLVAATTTGGAPGTTTPDGAGWSYRSTLDLPLSGTWRIELAARLSKFDEPVTQIEIEIAP